MIGHPVVLVGLGGMAGAIARYYVGLAIAQRLGLLFPYGTLLINVSGCLVLGFVATLGAEREGLVSPEIRLLVGMGFCGAYTTFSTFGYETVTLFRAGSHLAALAYVVGSNVLGLAAVAVGYYLARLWP